MPVSAVPIISRLWPSWCCSLYSFLADALHLPVEVEEETNELPRQMYSDPGEVTLQNTEVVDVGWVVLAKVTALHFEEFPGKKGANGHIDQE